VIKRSGEQVPFDQERITFAIYKAAASVGGRDTRRAKRLSDRVVMILEDRCQDKVPHVEEIQDLIEEVLITAGHVKTARSFIVYRESRRAAREQSLGKSRAPHGPVPYRVLWETLTWNNERGCGSINGVNYAVKSKKIDGVIRDAEARFDNELTAVAEQIAAKREEVKLVIVAGPSSSGKTTTTGRLVQKLLALGVEPVAINVDNYFRDLEYQPKDEKGDYDYETPEAIDIPLFNDHLEKLITGKEIQSPYFDFQKGKRLDDQTPMKLKKGQVVLIDTLHGLYKDLTARIPEEVKYKVYIEALVQLLDKKGKWVKCTDLRMLRRMARDRVHRNVSPRQTLEHWHYVRRSEKKHIIPYLGDADFVINGCLPYEIPLYRPILLPFIEEFITKKSHSKDALERAERVAELLRSIEGMEDREAIPKDSVVREFIGGGEV
jgi:uridine kinase